MDTQGLIHLSRLEITGSLNIHTPMCVIHEVATIHNVKIPEIQYGDVQALQAFIDIINKTHSHRPSIPFPIEEHYQMSLVASFVNKFIDWSESELEEAFATLRMYMIEACLPNINNFSYGELTPGNTRSLNACCLYRICKSYNLPTNFNHTIEQLAQAVRILIMDIEKTRKYMFQQIHKLDENEISSIYLSICHMLVDDSNLIEKNTETTDEEMPDFYNDVNNSVALFNNYSETLKRVYPCTPGEAITLAALIYKLDISSSRDPIAEYVNLRKTSSMWVPLDNDMIHALSLNPMVYNLECYFNPVLPYELYNEKELIHLALGEGYSIDNLRYESAYSLLASSYLLPTFHHGLFPSIINEKTPITLENVNEVEPFKILCYGTRISGVVAMTYQGLADVIKNQRNFSNPVDEDCTAFTQLNIRKLKRLCKTFRGGETQETMKEKENLLEAIQIAELFTENNNEKARELYIAYIDGDEKYKHKVINALYSLLRLSMYTRGWLNDEDVLPIKSAPVYNQAEVDIKVSEGIVDFENKCKELDVINDGQDNEDSDSKSFANIILDLPLVRYRHEWQTSNSYGEGLTLGERLKILKTGEDDENGFSSCMRLTSNWLAGSAYRYLTVIGEEKPFDIEDLREIS
ncbi:hypothetical protein DRO61_09040 [Candidatus Bathyarchaeota archaeon]|nr:MAG: hypothetical protein DRO61_09040 [Candidatus Bathyarchaeota archaeon]